MESIRDKILQGDNESALSELKPRYKIMKEAVRANPKLKKSNDYIYTTGYIGMCYSNLGMWRQALKFYKLSTELVYIPDIYKNYAYTLLHNGELSSGMDIYDNRYKSSTSDFNLPQLSLPHIKEISRLGVTDRVIVINEQGLGDDILFSRSLQVLSERVLKVKWKCPPPLLEVYKHQFKDLKNVEFFTKSPLNQSEVKDYTCWSLAGDLFSSLPKEEMFDNRVSGRKVDMRDDMNIAISYRTNAVNMVDGVNLSSRKNIDPSIFDNLIGSHNVINFTVGDEIEAIKNYPNPSSYWETKLNIDKNYIDLCITIDSSFAHFTGMLGIPTIVLIGDYYDWRWKYINEDGYNKFFNSIRVIKKKDFIWN